jgi:hypothetical protein
VYAVQYRNIIESDIGNNSRRDLYAFASAEGPFIEYYNYIESELPVKIVSQRCQPVFRDFPEECQRLVQFSQKFCDYASGCWSHWIATHLYFVCPIFGPVCAVFPIIFRFYQIFIIAIQTLLFELHM